MVKEAQRFKEVADNIMENAGLLLYKVQGGFKGESLSLLYCKLNMEKVVSVKASALELANNGDTIDQLATVRAVNAIELYNHSNPS